MIKINLFALLIIFSSSSLVRCMDNADIKKLSAFFYKFNKQMPEPLKSLKDAFFKKQFPALPLIQKNVRNFQNILTHDSNSFTFMAEYLISQETGFNYEGIFNNEHWSYAHVRVIFDEVPSIKKFDFASFYRTQLGLTMAHQTCNSRMEVPELNTVYVNTGTDPSRVVGLHLPSGRDFRENIQGFKEQQSTPLVVKIGSKSKNMIVTVQIMEAYSKTLNQPVSEFYSTVNEDDYIYILSRLSFMGNSLYGMKVLHGSISLNNVGVSLAMRRLNEDVIKTVDPVLKLEDSMVNMSQNFKDEQNYVDTILRYEDDYRAPWIEASGQMVSQSPKIFKYEYSYELKEDGYALYELIMNYIELNNLGENEHVVKLMEVFEEQFPDGIESLQSAPTGKDLHELVQASLKESGFYKNRILI